MSAFITDGLEYATQTEIQNKGSELGIYCITLNPTSEPHCPVTYVKNTAFKLLCEHQETTVRQLCIMNLLFH